MAGDTDRTNHRTSVPGRVRHRAAPGRRRRLGSVALPAIVLVVVVVATVRPVGGQRVWVYAVAVAAVFVSRGLWLGRPVTGRHTAVAGVLLVGSPLILATGHDAIAWVTLASTGIALVWPTSERPHPELLPVVAALVDSTPRDPLAPFAMHSYKSYFVAGDGRAALGYHARLGIAVVSGDPIGDPDLFPALVAGFRAHCRSRGWRVMVLAAGEHRRGLWPDLWAVPIGRDVVIDVADFEMVGRRYRNLRQAVSRTRNAGVTTEVIAEVDVTEPLRSELREVAANAHGGPSDRGFSMILDHPLDGRCPGMLLAIARDADGVVQGFQRYGVAGGGTEISLDVPWRRPGAPNGVDERLSVAMVDHAREHGGERVSLAFAAFPELFDDRNRRWSRRVLYNLVHLGDPLLELESLYRYLTKFHALGERRYALLSLWALPIAAFAAMTLEFAPHRGGRASSRT